MIKYLVLADGTSAHTVKWIKELVKRFDIYIISFNGVSEELRCLVPKGKNYDFKTDINVSGGNFVVLKYVLKVAEIIKTVAPSFINAHYVTSYGTVAVLAILLCGYKGNIIMSSWGSDILVTPWKGKKYYYLTKFVLKKASLITSDSEYMTQKIRDIEPLSKVMTFPFGVEEVPNVSYEEKDYKCYFSNRALEKNYNIDLVVRLFAQLHEADSDLSLIIANDGTEKENLVKLVECLELSGCIKFVGYLRADEQSYYYKKCGYYFSLPTSDSTAVSLLEAMAYGCIPLVSDLPANREWIIHGKNGLIVKDGVFLNGINLKNASDFNRKLIQERAVWRDNVAKYVDNLLDL